MNANLKVYDDKLRELEATLGYDRATANEALPLPLESLEEWFPNHINFSDKLWDFIPVVDEVIATLSPEEIAQAYFEGCHTLQQFLAAEIYGNFHEEYIPVVFFAIENDHKHAYRLFAGVDETNENRDAMLLRLLQSKWRMNVDTALATVQHNKLKQFRKIVTYLSRHDSPLVVELANEALQALDEDTPS